MRRNMRARDGRQVRLDLDPEGSSDIVLTLSAMAVQGGRMRMTNFEEFHIPAEIAAALGRQLLEWGQAGKRRAPAPRVSNG